MPGKIKIGSVVHAFELLPPKRKFVLDVLGTLRIMRKLVLTVPMVPQFVSINAEFFVPLHALGVPVLKPLFVVAGFDEKLHLHLFELTCAKDKVAWRNLVAKRLSNLCNPKGNFLPRRLHDVQEVDVRTLSGLRT